MGFEIAFSFKYWEIVMALISIIVPAYQVESFLHRCVNSILEQYFQDFEVILVDDGSLDGSGRICDEFALKDDRIQVIHRKNGGLSAARNTGIDWAFESSNSDWLAFVDSDDWVHPTFLDYLYRAATANHVQISVCGFVETDKSVPFPNQLYEGELWNWASFLMEKRVEAIIACNKLYAKHLYFDLRYPVGKLHEDEYITYKLLHRAEKVAYLPAGLYYYFQNVNSITHERFSIQRLDAMDAFLECVHYVSKLKNDELMAFCIHRFLSYCWEILPKLRNAEWIDNKLRIEEEKVIKRKFQYVLARYGMRYNPPTINIDYYKYAFPTLYGITRIIFRFVKGIRRKIE